MNLTAQAILAATACVLLAGCRTTPKPKVEVQTPIAKPAAAINLTGTTWALEQIDGKPAIAQSKATLAFLEGGRVTGNGSCNRFTGSVAFTGESIKIGPLAGTKMMCDPASSGQETVYLKALEAAQKYSVKDGKLLLFASGLESSLQFRAAAAEESNKNGGQEPTARLQAFRLAEFPDNHCDVALIRIDLLVEVAYFLF